MNIALFTILAAGLATQWIPARWAWGAEQVAIFALAIAWLIGFAVTGGTRIRSLSLLPLTGAVAIGCVQLLTKTTVDRWATSEQILTWFTWLTAHWIALQICSDPAARLRFLRLAGGLGIALAVLAILHRTTSAGKVFWWFETGRSFVMGVFPYENQYAAFVLVTLPVVLIEALTGPRNSRLGWMLGAAIMVGSVISSAAVAGAMLVLLEPIPVVAWMARRSRGTITASAVRTLAALLVVAIGIGFVGGWKDMVTDLERKNPLRLRQDLSASTIAMARDRWMTGWGLGTWTEVYPAYARFDDGVFDNAAHNDWAQWTAEGGVPMLALMAVFLFLVARAVRRSPLAIGLLLALAHDLIEFHFQERPAFGSFFFAFAGAVLAAANSPGENHARIS